MHYYVCRFQLIFTVLNLQQNSILHHSPQLEINTTCVFLALETCEEEYKLKITFLTYLPIYLYIYLFGVLRCFQHCTGHFMTGS